MDIQPILLSFCEAELEEVSGHEREQQTRRQLMIPSPLQTNDTKPLQRLTWGQVRDV